MQVLGACAQSQPGQTSGMCGPSSFRDDRLPAGLFSVRSGGGMTGAVGSTRSSLSIELSGDHGVVYYVCAHLRRRRHFFVAFCEVFGGANWPSDLGVNEGWQPTRRAFVFARSKISKQSWGKDRPSAPGSMRSPVAPYQKAAPYRLRNFSIRPI
jgi:hypothetical protein